MDCLNTLFPDTYFFTGDFTYWIAGKNPDFCRKGHSKKCVEMFGDYWHKGEDPKHRIAHFKDHGWKCLVLWEHELYDSMDDVIRKLEEFNKA